MQNMPTANSANAILAGLAPEDVAVLHSGAEHVTFDRADSIVEPGEGSPYVYFPTEGVLSLVGTTSGGGTVEVAVVGNEGVIGVPSFFGNHPLPFGVVAQVPTRVIRVPHGIVAEAMADCGELHRRILAYTHQLLAQVAQSAVCNRFHSAKQRLARWLLMIAERAGMDVLPLTHEFISSMVGGPRSAVTEAASELRDSGAIDYRRGLIVIRDPELLRRHACECYGVLREDHAAVVA